jgi:proteasome lid subunit RPN8/RPN11
MTMATPLSILSSAAGEISRHGERTYPDECCGALIGRDRTVLEVVALPNVTDEGPRRRFRIQPADYLAAERRARELRGDLLGFYHSHPDAEARPSQYDLDHAWPNLSYIITSVRDGAAANTTSWRLVDDRSRFEEEPLITVERASTAGDRLEAV